MYFSDRKDTTLDIEKIQIRVYFNKRLLMRLAPNKYSTVLRSFLSYIARFKWFNISSIAYLHHNSEFQICVVYKILEHCITHDILTLFKFSRNHISYRLNIHTFCSNMSRFFCKSRHQILELLASTYFLDDKQKFLIGHFHVFKGFYF